MLRLDRTKVAAPPCLAGYNYRTQSWSELGGPCKQQLRAALVELQGLPGVTGKEANEYGLRCAYCEGIIFHQGHIEHFRRKNPRLGYPELTFEWSNLFLACGAKNHCGHYKDRREAPPYDPDQLIKPDQHDAAHYLYFHSTGEVDSRHRLAGHEQQRADTTINIFGLNDPVLKGARAKAVRGYLKMKQEDFEELAAWDEATRNEYLLNEIEETRWDPYATTIRHFLQTV